MKQESGVRDQGSGKGDSSLTPDSCLLTPGTHLLPEFDQALSALLSDLSERGLLDDTLVLVMGEFGRTPVSTTPTAAAAITGRGRTPPSSPAARFKAASSTAEPTALPARCVTSRSVPTTSPPRCTSPSAFPTTRCRTTCVNGRTASRRANR
jgi:Protein of unknown function (DUF1501)